MTVKIIKIENDGFNHNEIESLTSAFIAAISKLKPELVKNDTWFELVELEDANIMMIVTLKRINGYGQWEAKVFAKINSLKIVAVDD